MKILKRFVLGIIIYENKSPFYIVLGIILDKKTKLGDKQKK